MIDSTEISEKTGTGKPVADASDMQFDTEFFWYQFPATNWTALYFRVGLQ